MEQRARARGRAASARAPPARARRRSSPVVAPSSAASAVPPALRPARRRPRRARRGAAAPGSRRGAAPARGRRVAPARRPLGERGEPVLERLEPTHEPLGGARVGERLAERALLRAREVGERGGERLDLDVERGHLVEDRAEPRLGATVDPVGTGRPRAPAPPAPALASRPSADVVSPARAGGDVGRARGRGPPRPPHAP